MGFVWAKNKLLLKKAPEQRGYNIAQCENRIILSLQIDKSNSLLAVKMVQIVDQIGILYIIGLINISLLQINKILEASSVWASYRDQKYNLFISEKPATGYLTGGTGVAGYLTMCPGNPSTMSSVPPPVETDHPVENNS